MKTLVLLFSIIFASFQLGNIFSIDFDKTSSSETVETLVIEPPVALVANLAVNEAPAKPEKPEEHKDEPTRRTININSSTNQKFIALHQQMLKNNAYLEMNDVKFNFDRFDLKDSESFNILLHFADKLIFDETLKISISGFTDNIGEEYYNDMLSYNRTETIRTYIRELGVPSNQIVSSFNGTELPIASNETEQGRADNRRVEIILFR